MPYEIVRIAVELFAPEALIHGRNLVKWYTQFDHFHAKRLLYPVKPPEFLFEIQEEGLRALEDCAFLRLAPIGTTFTGATNGLMDDILTRVRLDFFLGPILPHLVQHAITHAPPYRMNRTQYTWLGLFEVEPNGETGDYLGEIDMTQLKTIVKI